MKDLAIGVCAFLEQNSAVPAFDCTLNHLFWLGQPLSSKQQAELERIAPIFEVDQETAARTQLVHRIKCGFVASVFNEGQWSASATLLIQHEDCRVVIGGTAEPIGTTSWNEDRLIVQVSRTHPEWVVLQSNENQFTVRRWMPPSRLSFHVFRDNQLEHLSS